MIKERDRERAIDKKTRNVLKLEVSQLVLNCFPDKAERRGTGEERQKERKGGGGGNSILER